MAHMTYSKLVFRGWLHDNWTHISILDLTPGKQLTYLWLLIVLGG